jgi:hypothetical protein
MNERIQELIKQAGDYVNEVYIPPVRSKTPDKIWEDGHIAWTTLFNEKLAELIVRECIDTVSDCSVEYCTRPQIVSEIKEHFGVEE